MCQAPLRRRKGAAVERECDGGPVELDHWIRLGRVKGVSSACIQRSSAIERSHEHLVHGLTNSCR